MNKTFKKITLVAGGVFFLGSGILIGSILSNGGTQTAKAAVSPADSSTTVSMREHHAEPSHMYTVQKENLCVLPQTAVAANASAGLQQAQLPETASLTLCPNGYPDCPYDGNCTAGQDCKPQYNCTPDRGTSNSNAGSGFGHHSESGRHHQNRHQN